MNPSHSDPHPLVYTFLGPPAVLRGGVRVAGGRFDRPLALLAYLAAHPGPREREELASLLWPRKPPSAARANLSTNLHYLDRRLGTGFLLEKTPRTVGWIDRHPPWDEEPVDLRRYLRVDPPEGCSIRHSPGDCPACRRRLEAQREMGRYIFLDEVSFEGMGEYGQWVKAFRQGLIRRQSEIESLLSGKTASPGRVFSVSLPELEIRQATLLSVLLEAPGGMEPEEIVGLRKAFREAMEEQVQEEGGSPLEGSEGTFLAVFGFPKVREDETRRAVRAAFGLRRAATSDPRFRECGIRLALHTGEGIVDRTGGVPDPLGDRIREVNRVVRHGAPGKITATYETACRVERSYIVAPADLLPKGTDGPERRLYWIQEERLVWQTPASALVGRRKEQSQMWELWRAAKAERALRTLWLVGEAGIGKSALLEELAKRIRAEGREDGSTWQISCLPEHRESPYASIVRFLKGSAGLRENLSPSEYRYRLERYLLSLGQPVQENLSVLLHLLNAPETSWEDLYPPENQKKAIKSLFLSILVSRSEKPCLLAVDDLHWTDLATLELLKKLIDTLSTRPVLVVLTARREGDLREADLPPPNETMRLSGLSREESRRLIEGLSPAPLSPETLQERIDRGGGIPLYLRELALLDPPVPGQGPGVPPTLQDLLTSRIDALDESNPMAKVAACLGLSLDEEILLRATERYARLPSGSRTAETWLQELVDREILDLDRPPPSPAYQFRHDLVREAVLQSLPASVRRRIHRAVSHALREDFPESGESAPEVLAGHFLEADVPEEALPLFVKAGERAEGIGAYESALSHYAHALDLLVKGHGGPDAKSPVVRLLRKMIRIGLYVWGHGSARVNALLGKLSEISGSGDPEVRKIFDLVRIAVNLGTHGPGYFIERFGEPEALERVAGESEEIRQWLAWMRGVALFYNGQVDRSYGLFRELLPKARALRWEIPMDTEAFSESPAILLLSVLGFASQIAGRTKESLAFLSEGERREECNRFPKSQVYVGIHKICAAWVREDTEKAAECAEETLLLAESHGLQVWEKFCRLALAWCRGTKESLSRAETARIAIEGMFPGVAPLYAAIHADAAFRAALWEKTIRLARHGRAKARQTGAVIFDPHLLTLEGLALLAMDSRENRKEARTLFEGAIGEARRSGAVWYGIRAAMALASIDPEEKNPLRGFLESLPEEPEGEDAQMVRQARMLARDGDP